jgi:hypothetical protein
MFGLSTEVILLVTLSPVFCVSLAMYIASRWGERIMAKLKWYLNQRKYDTIKYFTKLFSDTKYLLKEEE